MKKDHEAREIEQQEILELENNLASGAGKNFVSEGNSVLLGQLIRFDPKGPIRKPSPQLLEIMKSLNANLKLGLLLCKSRNPDFLIEIINGKGSANSLPWLIDMIDSNHGCLTVLPVQCLCEFLLHSMKDGMELSGHHQSAAETPPTPKKDKTGRPKENQRQKRTEELRERLRSIIWDKNDAEMITQIVGYFLSRLQAECYEARSLAIKVRAFTLCGLSRDILIPIFRL